MGEEFINSETLLTFGGLVNAVVITEQFTKSLLPNRIKKSVVRPYAFLVALALSFVFAGDFSSVQAVSLTVINAMIVTISAMLTYELVNDPKADK